MAIWVGSIWGASSRNSFFISLVKSRRPELFPIRLAIDSHAPFSHFGRWRNGSGFGGLAHLHGGQQAADTDFHSAQVVDVVNFQLGVELSARFQNIADFIRGDGVEPASE